jgi:hypothetical protein
LTVKWVPVTNLAPNQVSKGSASAEQDRGGAQGGRVGRRVGITLVWISLCYVVGASASSIIPSLFWPDLAPRPPRVPTERCAHEIAALDRALRDGAAARLRGDQRVKLGVWLREWDGRYMTLTGGCGPLEGARKDLYKLRNDLEALLQRYDNNAGKTQQRIEHALEPIGGTSIPPRSGAGLVPARGGAGTQPARSKG